ncbi:protein virilizer [Teleopsis dalmanni]|uniref:protein virilizer n=1 Tax=Teleopsis dalmanni TaxID=139649 RepID=UPI0018CEFF6B|nr:protein virilizer [Teleopsis dalmanni]
MSENDNTAQLLFFDTFSHEVDTDINLDLVQFPKPVYIKQVRIIPLGARVQADFPGGVRLGATNPSTFDIEFFVNDLGLPGASAFENLGQLQYNQNDCIHLECNTDILTDGLVLRGWYSTITLAIYGSLTNTISEQIQSPPPQHCEMTDDIANISSDERNIPVQENPVKSEWKEPLPTELAHPHKISVSELEPEELDYGLPREHYHHSGDERDRRLRKTSNSSERSLSSRNRTHSENNDRDYMRSRCDREREREREKPARNWSRSPEYSRHSRRKRSERSRSDAEEAHKWPRTPPASIDSPLRPRSPDNMEYADEDLHYKLLKSRSYMRSNESLDNTEPEPQDVEDESNSGPTAEQFEPILSDDEIIGDDDSNTVAEPAVVDEYELELDAAAATPEAAIVEFDPFKMPILKHNNDLSGFCSKDIEGLKLLFKNVALQTKCNINEFRSKTITVEERENFVFLSEQIINQLSYLAQQYKRRNFVLQHFFESEPKNLSLAFTMLQIGLDFDVACLQPQPALKIRHIKIGARLAELLGGSPDFLEYILKIQAFDPFQALFTLFHKDYMALSIKLMLLKSVSALLDTRIGLEHFINAKVNGYQLVVKALQFAKEARTKFVLQAIIKKLHLIEALQYFKYYGTTLDPKQQIEFAIDQILDALNQNSLSYQQPKRFLPVSKKFEIITDATAQRNFANALQGFFKAYGLGETLVMLLSNASDLQPLVLLRITDLIDALLKSHVGLDYFVDDCFETTQILIAVLLGIDDVPVTEAPEIITDEVKIKKMEIKVEESTDIESADATKTFVQSPDNVIEETNDTTEDKSLGQLEETSDTAQSLERQNLHRLQVLGIELAYKVQTRYHLDAIVSLATSNAYDAIPLTTHLHALYSHTCNSSGRRHTVDVLGANNNLHIFMELIKKEQRLQSQRLLTSPAKYKSPVLSYAVDLVDCCVRYCENLDYLIEHGRNILDLAKNHETFEPSVSAVLQEMFVYLKPLEAINIFDYDDIAPLVEVITRSLEYITTFPGDLIMGLRIFRHLAIGPIHKGLKSTETEELKHRFVALQFYAADGVQTLLQILEKLCNYFEQPGLHAPALMTIQSVHCCQIILPTLQILRQMLCYAIQCRDIEFKDLTAIDHLMKTYFLMHYMPAASPAKAEVESAKEEIIKILLAYTQPNEQDEESLHKSLWTQMIRDILKNIESPSTFIPGLHVFTQLLPLPLPIPLNADMQLTRLQTQRLITERKLWSAHLHPQSHQIAKLIETLAPSSFPQLTDLFTRVCVQLADLAPNMTLLISKTFADLICNEWSNASNAPSLHLARLLNIFSRLSAYATLKSSALSILSGKLWEVLQAVLLNTEAVEIVFKCQLYIHRILESYLDSEISLIAPNSTSIPELNLASALPPKEIIPQIAESILMNVINTDITHEVSSSGVRNLVILTEHDITFHHLALVLKQKSTDVQQWMKKIIDLNEGGNYNSNIESLALLIRSLTHIEETAGTDATVPPRTLKIVAKELMQIIGYKKNCNETNLLQQIVTIMEQQNRESMDNLFSDLKSLIDELEGCDDTPLDTEDEKPILEQLLPQTESIVTQYDARPTFTIYETEIFDEKQLTARYWLKLLQLNELSAEEYSTQSERVSCDLNELVNSCLPPETNLTTDCKRILHLSASPQSNRERTPTAPCFRTRRVEVEPSTGRVEKKIYVTPVRGRGFARAPPTRGDLFRSRPPNTSRPPSLHVDDFLALETCGAQPTGPTGYNKIPPLMRGSRVGRNRGSRILSSAAFRKTKLIRTGSPSWNEGPPHYRTMSGDTHFGTEPPHYAPSSHFITRPRGRGLRLRSYMR